MPLCLKQISSNMKEETMSATCPRCSEKMRIIKLNDTELDLCDGCEGVWFDRNELDAVLKMGEASASQSTLAPSFDAEFERKETPGMGGLKCPRCNSELFRYNYMISSGIIIDGCEKGCGIFMDDGEIRKVFRFAVEQEKELDPETEKRMKALLAATEQEAKMKEEKLIDSLVLMDNRGGIMSIPGKVLQGIYRIFYKMGL